MKLLRGKASSAEVRTLNGRDHLVVPVVALVEGVRHASGAEHPELVLASAFGRFPETWNGRPVVVDHPVDGDGRGMSASQPEVLEESYLGKLLNTKVEDGKLKVEAWLDLVAIEASESDKVLDMWTRLDAGEVVEVSVGAIVTVKDVEGEWEGKEYKGVWDTVIPDHLAFLGGDQTGACSISDGCGTYRIQSSGRIQLSEGVRMATKAAMKKVKAASDVQVVALGSECGCKGKKGDGSGAGSGEDDAAREQRLVDFASRALFEADTLDVDRRAILGRALRERFGNSRPSYVMAYSDTTVVFEQFDGSDFKLYELGYSSGDGNAVTLATGDPVEVMFQSKVVPVTSGDEGKEKKQMSGAASAKLAAKSKSGPPPSDDEEDDEEEETTSSKKTKEAKSDGKAKGKAKKMSAHDDEEDGLDAPSSMTELMKQFKGTALGRELSEMVAFASAAKDKAKKAILSSKGGKHFTEDMLDAMDLKVLSSMADALNEDAEDEADETDEAEVDDDADL